MIATITMNSKITHPLLGAGIIGLLIGVGSYFCLNVDGYFCELMTAAPIYFMYVTGKMEGVWSEVIVVAYYMTIFILPIYLSSYFPIQYLSRKKSLILAIVVTLTTHAVFTYLGANLMGDVVQVLGDAMRHGALDSIFGE